MLFYRHFCHFVTKNQKHELIFCKFFYVVKKHRYNVHVNFSYFIMSSLRLNINNTFFCCRCILIHSSNFLWQSVDSTHTITRISNSTIIIYIVYDLWQWNLLTITCASTIGIPNSDVAQDIEANITIILHGIRL